METNLSNINSMAPRIIIMQISCTDYVMAYFEQNREVNSVCKQ